MYAIRSYYVAEKYKVKLQKVEGKPTYYIIGFAAWSMTVEPMTPQGYDELLREFKYLKEIEKPRVNQEKQRAAELGDRSENVV